MQKALQLLLSLVPSLSPCELSLLHCCSREERNERGDKAFFKLVLDFNKILSSAVTRCLLVFTIQLEDKVCTRKELKESQASRARRDS